MHISFHWEVFNDHTPKMKYRGKLSKMDWLLIDYLQQLLIGISSNVRNIPATEQSPAIFWLQILQFPTKTLQEISRYTIQLPTYALITSLFTVNPTVSTNFAFNRWQIWRKKWRSNKFVTNTKLSGDGRGGMANEGRDCW